MNVEKVEFDPLPIGAPEASDPFLFFLYSHDSTAKNNAEHWLNPKLNER